MGTGEYRWVWVMQAVPLLLTAERLILIYRGDPKKMALWGQSAGAISVHYYLYSYADNPIVHAFIADSGGPSSSPENSTDYTHSNFTAIAGLVGCGGLDSAGEFGCSESNPIAISFSF